MRTAKKWDLASHSPSLPAKWALRIQLLPPAFHLRTLLAVQPSSGPLLLLAGNVAIRSMKVTEKGHILRRQERRQESCLAVHQPKQLVKIGVEGLNGSKLVERCLFLDVFGMSHQNPSIYVAKQIPTELHFYPFYIAGSLAPCEIANDWITMDNKHAHQLPISSYFNLASPSSMGIDGKLAGMRGSGLPSLGWKLK